MAFTAPVVKGRVRPRYRFNIELPDGLAEWLEEHSAESGEAKTQIIQRLLVKEQKRVAKKERAIAA